MCTGLYSSRSPSLYQSVCFNQFASSRWWWSGAVVRAARLLPRLRGDHRSARRLNQVVELERFDPRVLNTRLLSLICVRVARLAVGDLVYFLHAFDQHVRKAKHAAVSLHGPAYFHAHLCDRLAVFLAVEPR